MNYRLPFLAALAAVVASPAAVAQVGPQVAPAPNADIAAVQAHLRAVTTMTADFTQTDRAGKVLTGKLTMKRPGKVRFQYQQGVPILIIADGNSLWFIDYSVAQVQRWPIGNSPLAALLDPSRDLGRLARVVPTDDPRILFIEAKDPKRPEYGTLTLAFAREAGAPAGLRLQGWIVLDGQNNRTTVRLTGQQFNVPLGDEAFRWRDPRTGRGPR